jgi:MFS superfamily sulfate permease-like transporter
VLVVRAEGPLFYANVVGVKERVIALARTSDPRPRAVVLDLAGNPDLDVESVDTLAELATALAEDGIALRLGAVHRPAADMLERGGVASRAPLVSTLDGAVGGTD